MDYFNGPWAVTWEISVLAEQYESNSDLINFLYSNFQFVKYIAEHI